MRTFRIGILDNGIVIESETLGDVFGNKVFGDKDIEEALTDIYHRISNEWHVGDEVRIHRAEERKKKEV